MEKVAMSKVKIKDSLWSYYQKLAKEKIIPYQWRVLNDEIEGAPPSKALTNMRIAAGLEEGEFHGFVFQDSDIAKWLEAVAYRLAIDPNQELEEIADGVIDLLEKAQMPDGYLNTFFTIKQKGKRWTNLHEAHELYCFGHMAEAAVAYFEATKKTKFLQMMCKFADHIDTLFGEEEGKLRGYDGHQECELALVKLYRATANEKYLKLADYFLRERGKEPFYFEEEWKKSTEKSVFGDRARPDPSSKWSREYNQSHKQPIHQEVAVGHAVRLVYMLIGMSEVAYYTQNQDMLEACKKLWDNIYTKQLYITGGIGQTKHGEAFSFDYDLPNDKVYAETCASIGLMLASFSMLQNDLDGKYADVMESALYNTVLAGVSIEGERFFYVNPLEVVPKACEKDADLDAVKPVRQSWFPCACCPPNVARTLTSLGKYIYTYKENTLYTHLYIGSEMSCLLRGEELRLVQEGNYPFEESVTFTIQKAPQKKIKLAFREPKWSNGLVVKVNGEQIEKVESITMANEKGYVWIENAWKEEDQIEITFDLGVRFMSAHPLVRQDAGKVAVKRGPIVYCVEEVDNGTNLHTLLLNPKGTVTLQNNNLFEGGAKDIYLAACQKVVDAGWSNQLYKPLDEKTEEVKVKLVPYFLWGNRNSDRAKEMRIWLRHL
jgi:hypothetical protein